MHLIWGVIVVFGSYFTRADVHELQVNERAYLPPDNKIKKVSEEYLPSAEKEVKEVIYSQNNQCNLPMIVYNDAPPVKVKSKLNNEYLPPAKEEGKVLAIIANNQPKVVNDTAPIKPEHNIQDAKLNQAKVLTIKPKQPVNREYLPPSNDNKHTKAIAQDYQHNQPKVITDPLPIGQQLSYQHNQPKAIDDPLPIRINYIQPLRLDFLDGQLKPITKGPLFTGLFLNASEIKLSTERLPKKIRFNQTKTAEINQNMKSLSNSTSSGKEIASQTKAVNYELKTEHSLQNTKYHKKFEDDIVLINYPDATTNFKLFNSDDDTLLSGSAPEIIFKPGDDISFVHDTSIIDDYEHIPAKAKKAEMSLTTTTTNPTTSTTTIPLPLPLKAYTTLDQDQDATQAALEQEQSNETEIEVTDHGYSYEKPKYESIQEHTTEALSKQADECGITEMDQPYTEIRENKPLTNEQPIAEDDAISAEHQSNENDHSHSGAGYFYEKPKIPFDF